MQVGRNMYINTFAISFRHLLILLILFRLLCVILLLYNAYKIVQRTKLHFPIVGSLLTSKYLNLVRRIVHAYSS